MGHPEEQVASAPWLMQAQEKEESLEVAWWREVRPWQTLQTESPLLWPPHLEAPLAAAPRKVCQAQGSLEVAWWYAMLPWQTLPPEELHRRAPYFAQPLAPLQRLLRAQEAQSVEVAWWREMLPWQTLQAPHPLPWPPCGEAQVVSSPWILQTPLVNLWTHNLWTHDYGHSTINQC